MNARQKAKHYKKRLDELLKHPIPIKYVYKSDYKTITVAKNVPADMVLADANEAQEQVFIDLAHLLSEEIVKYAHFDTIFNIDYNEYKVVAFIDLVKPEYRRVNIFSNEVNK